MADQPVNQRDAVLHAVQAALTGFGEQVKAELSSLRESMASEQQARGATEAQIAALASTLARSQDQSSGGLTDLQRRIEEVSGDLDAGRDDGAKAIDDAVAKFNETNASAIAEAVAKLEARLAASEQSMSDELKVGLAAVDERLAASEQSMSDELKVGLAAVDERRVAAEQKAADDLASRLAALDDEFERSAAGVESSFAALNERSNATDQRLDDLVHRLEALASTVTAMGATLAEVDVDVIDELSDRVSSAAGEVVIIQIEAERFQKSVEQTYDRLQLRLVEVETSIQEQAMDVETAVQLERLEEIERALIELDPAQFVRVGAPTSDDDAPISDSSGETGDVVAGQADDSVSE